MDSDSRFVCSICLEPVVEPVVTLCGHLFCWPCLYRWTQRSARLLGSSDTLPNETPLCPVCKATIPSENVIPLYVVARSGPVFKERKEEDLGASVGTPRLLQTQFDPLLTASPPSSASAAPAHPIPRRPSPVWPAATPGISHASLRPPPSALLSAAPFAGSSSSRSDSGSGGEGMALSVVQLSFNASTGSFPSLFALQFQPSFSPRLGRRSNGCDGHELALRAALALGAMLTFALLFVA